MFSRSKNPLNNNTRIPPSITKKGSVMFDDGDGITFSTRTFDDNYYELDYYDIENNQPYYRENTGYIINSWDVNYKK